MYFPPPFTGHLPKLPLENMKVLAVDRLFWISGYDVEKHEWIKFQGLNCDTSTYDKDAWSKLVKDRQTKDLIQSILDTIGCSPGNAQPEKVRRGMNILLQGALGTGRKTVAHAVCNILKRPMLDIRVNDIPCLTDVKLWADELALLAVNWNAVMVVHRGDYFMKSRCADNRKRINTVIQSFESSGCICLWPSVLTDEQKTLIRSFSITIEFPDLDLEARRQRWLQLFGRDDLVGTYSSGEPSSVPTVMDTEVWTFIREIEKISWYELNGVDIQNFMDEARDSGLAEGRDPTPQDVKKSIKSHEVPLPVRSKIARFFALREMDPPDSASEEPSFSKKQ
ncbi:uncharacterized protein EDB93DRAFT_827508 [Suillus bovinus]|uniref:uncharacterized protein n=1 Tax=Suillus bovinus TaxID=48563 RepID=UPI001B8854E2|nr:uncharacterized protein EDB93DRAFT_827508 [Suillus bovinus]KAG2135395.1 hypothetical protein EDB93DRAFT_827508 [Suillus bovinus]